MRTCLQIAGILQLALSVAHFGFARRFGWRNELQKVSLLTRQIFWVHTGFLMLVLAGFGCMSLLHADELLAGNSLGRFVLASLTVFWATRWFCQFFVYRAELWRGNALHTTAHILFAGLWTFLGTVYGMALVRSW